MHAYNQYMGKAVARNVVLLPPAGSAAPSAEAEDASVGVKHLREFSNDCSQLPQVIEAGASSGLCLT